MIKAGTGWRTKGCPQNGGRRRLPTSAVVVLLALAGCGVVNGGQSVAVQTSPTPSSGTPPAATVTPQPTPVGTTVVSVTDPSATPLLGPGGAAAEWLLYPGDTSAAVISPAQALGDAQNAGALGAFLGPSSAPITWSSPVLARLQLMVAGTPYGGQGALSWIVIATQDYAGNPNGFPGRPDMTPPPAAMRQHYTVVAINALTGEKDGLWDLPGPATSS